jgi:hypothetical protein
VLSLPPPGFSPLHSVDIVESYECYVRLPCEVRPARNADASIRHRSRRPPLSMPMPPASFSEGQAFSSTFRYYDTTDPF